MVTLQRHLGLNMGYPIKPLVHHTFPQKSHLLEDLGGILHIQTDLNINVFFVCIYYIYHLYIIYLSIYLSIYLYIYRFPEIRVPGYP